MKLTMTFFKRMSSIFFCKLHYFKLIKDLKYISQLTN